MKRFRLTASATSALPRSLLFAICVIYVLAGLFGRDPWKNEDAAGFGVMWTMAQGHWHDWLLPNIAGKSVFDSGPLIFWFGALVIRLAHRWLSAPDAARIVTGLCFYATCAFVWYSTYLLGRRAEVQPFKYAFGGEPEPRDYGRTLADGALLILLACFGLAERGHETTAEVGQLTFVAMTLYGLVRSLDKPWQGAIWFGLALGGLTLTGSLALSLAVLLASAILLLVCRPLPRLALLLAGVPLGIALSATWPLATMKWAPGGQFWIGEWLDVGFDTFGGPNSDALFYTVKNLALFAWPAWPLALWSLHSWRGLHRAPHIAAPLAVLAPLALLVLLQAHQSNRFFILLLPSLAILSAFGLPTLKRGAINAFDWFAVLSFTILGSFVWLVWLAGLTGFPGQIARNLHRLVPGFQATFSWVTLVCAFAVTAAWIVLVVWRISRNPKVLWRSVVLSGGGTTLMWVLLMTLWLPLVNYGRTYRDVAAQIVAHLPPNYTCIRTARVGDAQLASFAYFGHMRFGEDNCNVLLRQDTQDYDQPGALAPYEWHLLWEGRRAADRDERFRLYELQERPHH
ncbi:MAG: glycosyltransferase family 39 protein [Burkholderiales bacterium]|nr:glycosyltransferase family 39 protein [Burkholderiales bacterium]